MTDKVSNAYHSVGWYGVFLSHTVMYVQSQFSTDVGALGQKQVKVKVHEITVMAMTCLDGYAFRHHQGSMNYSKRVEPVALKISLLHMGRDARGEMFVGLAYAIRFSTTKS